MTDDGRIHLAEVGGEVYLRLDDLSIILTEVMRADWAHPAAKEMARSLRDQLQVGGDQAPGSQPPYQGIRPRRKRRWMRHAYRP